MAHQPLFHDLQTTSGLGDRLLDSCAVLTLARLKCLEGELVMRWSDPPRGNKMPRSYSTDLVQLPACSFTQISPKGAVGGVKEFSFTEVNDALFAALPDGGRQIFLRSGRSWGTNSPDRLIKEAEFYGFDQSVDLMRIVDEYRRTARGINPAPVVAGALPAGLEERVGFHIRLTDKLVAKANGWEMSYRAWHGIECNGLACIDACIDRGEPMFICSDDLEYRQRLVDYINAKGGDVMTADLNAGTDQVSGFDAALDLFALSRCARIVQMTSYSTFSIAAALIGNVPLVNLSNQWVFRGHHMKIWRRTLPLLHSAGHELGAVRYLKTRLGLSAPGRLAF